MESEFVDTATGQTVAFEYSSINPVRNNIQNQLAPPTVAVSPVDFDSNGVVDQFNVTMVVKRPSNNLKFKDVSVIMGFNCELKDVVKMKMEGLAVVSEQF